MQKRKIAIICATSISTLVVAKPSNWYVGGSVTHNGKTETEVPDSAFGASMKMGYQLSPTWAIETSTGTYGQLDMLMTNNAQKRMRREPRYRTDLSLLGYLPISRRYKLYGGLGAMMENNDWSSVSQIGIRYNLDKHWSIDLGYKFIFTQDPEYKLQSLGLSARYRLPSTNRVQKYPTYDDMNATSTTQISHEVVSPPEKKTVPRADCKPKPYHVTFGDWLYKIANEHQITFAELKAVNNGFKDLNNINIIYPGQVIKVPNLQCK
ncbi:LysM peptidoglycan-binding domain-containing protein [Vibrio harveyi]